MKIQFPKVAGLLVALLFPLGLQAHGGGLDSLGCHHNRKLGGYHCHRGPLAGKYFSSKVEAIQVLQAVQSNAGSSTTSTAPSSVVESSSSAKTITAAEAKNHIGDTATVCGKVASSRYAASSRGRPTFLNLDKPYPNQIFTVVIWGQDRSRFGEPEEIYRDKSICVTGKIGSYRDVPQIVADDPGQIKVQSKGEK